MASCFTIIESSSSLSPNIFFILPIPGSIPIRPDIPPILRICFNWLAKSSRSKLPFAIFMAAFSASSRSIVSAAFSTRLTISPISKMRSAIREGWNGSNASVVSPTPINLIGLPVTARIDRAAPPRASPSIRVKTTPDTPICSLKFSAVVTAS